MTDFNPVSVEDAIRNCANRIAKGVAVVSNAYSQFLAADHEYDQAFARAYMAYDGASHAKKYAAELETVEERKARDLADAAYKYSDRQAKALEAELRAWQSVNKSVMGMYQAAGRGEGA